MDRVQRNEAGLSPYLYYSWMFDFVGENRLVTRIFILSIYTSFRILNKVVTKSTGNSSSTDLIKITLTTFRI